MSATAPLPETSPWRARLVRTRLGRRVDRAIFQPRGAESGEVVLNQRRVFILPTRAGLLLAVMLVALLLGSINYLLSLGFALTFLVVGVAWVGMLLTFRNLAHLRLRPVRVDPVFVGEPADYRLVIGNRSRFDRYAIELVVDGSTQRVGCDPLSSTEEDVVVPILATRRGRVAMPRITLVTRFPIGLWRAWSYWQPALVALVYPRPAEAGVPLPHAEGDGRDAQAHRVRGSDDFAGLRAYAKGDPVRHIAWRAMARNPEGRTLTKLFDGGTSGEVALTLDAAMALEPGLEPAISLLTRWVLDADAQGLRYSLVVPGLHLRSASGSAHRAACLEALALYRS
jgi:uncharacterized protein (DUF58 family)